MDDKTLREKSVARFKEAFPYLEKDAMAWHHFKMFYELGVRDSQAEFFEERKRLIEVDMGKEEKLQEWINGNIKQFNTIQELKAKCAEYEKKFIK